MATRKVTITLSNKIVGNYEARSYPHYDSKGSGMIQLYKVPLYKIIITGVDSAGKNVSFTHKAPRFMPFWNDPKNPTSHYSTVGWVDAGLSAARTIIVERYIRDYRVQNRYSPGIGAIVLKGSFFIHAGPTNEADAGFGSAGCVEIVGNYDIFKGEISSLSGLKSVNADDAITKLVADKHLVVIIQAAKAPNIKLLYTREVLHL